MELRVLSLDVRVGDSSLRVLGVKPKGFKFCVSGKNPGVVTGSTQYRDEELMGFEQGADIL